MNTFRMALLLSSAIVVVAPQVYAQTVITSSTDLTPGMITPNNGQPALNAGAVGGLATSALQPTGNTSSTPITGQLWTNSQVNLTTGGLSFWNGGAGTHVISGGSSPTTDAIFFTPTLQGVTSNGDLIHAAGIDNVIDQGTAFAFDFNYDNIGSYENGNRTVVMGEVVLGTTPAAASALTGVAAHSHVYAPEPVAQSYGWPSAVSIDSTTGGEIENGWDFNTLTAGATGVYANYDHEFDMDYEAGASVGENIAAVVVDQSPAYNTANGNGLPGKYANIAYDLLGGAGRGFQCAFCVGKETGTWGLNANGTILGAIQRMYGGTPDSGGIYPAARWDMDYRLVANGSNGGEIALPGFGISGSGAVGASSLTTTGTIQAQAATLTGATIDFAGVYPSVPTFTVQAPPSGTTATVAVTSSIVTAALNFGTTGKGYKANDVLTPSGSPGGTLPTFTVATVDAQGGITSLQINSAGSANAPINGPVAMTGGSGTGAVLLIAWGLTSSGTYQVLSPITLTRFAATGAGWAVGDTATVVGDTGTAGSYTVTKVSPQGGIEMPLTVKTPGSLTALASGTYHSLSASGSGTGGSIQVGYGVGSVSVTPGSGYVPNSPPVILSSETNWQHGNLSAVMTSAAAPLTINPAGGNVGIDRPTSVLFAQLDINGSVAAGSDYSQRGQFGYKAQGYNATILPGTSLTTADTAQYTFLAGYNGISRWEYAGAGLTSKEVTADVNGNSTIFEMLLDGSDQSRQVAQVTSGSTGTKTFAAADCGTYVRDTATTAHSDTVPTGLPVGCTIDVIQVGSGGTITFAGATGETVEQTGSGTLAHATTGQFADARIVIDSSSTFLLTGQVK